MISSFNNGPAQVRQQQKNGTLSIERKKCLDEIGFNWEPQISNFKERYKQLIEFQKSMGIQMLHIEMVNSFD